MKKFLLSFLVSMLVWTVSQAQQVSLFSQFFANPYLYNPAYVGHEGYTTLSLIHRRQWAGLEGAPLTSALTFELPISRRLALGLQASSDKRGILNTSTVLATLGYTIPMGEGQALRFGLSLGAESNGIDAAKASNPNDPALLGKGNSTSLQANSGMSYQYKGFTLGLALPKLLQSEAGSIDEYGKLGFRPTSTLLINTSYHFGGARVAFEPHLIYRRNANLTTQLEGIAVLYLSDILWVGGSYRQDYGSTAFVGLKARERFKFGYAYEIPSAKVLGPGNGTHEILLSFRFGDKKNNALAQKQQQEVERITALEENKPREESENEKPTKESAKKEGQKTQPTIVKNPPKPASPDIPTPLTDYIYKKGKEVNKPGKTEEKISIKAKKHTLEMEKGNYVIVAAFRVYDNALNYQRQLKASGVYCTITYSSATLYYYAYLYDNAQTLSQARQKRDVIRQQARFEDAWLLIAQ